MRILYITELWNGFEDLICKGKPEATGMPSFIYPLKEMIIKEGFLIDFAIVIKGPKELSIGAEWLKNSNYFWVFNRSFLKIFTILKIIQQGNYDFIYGQGGGGGWGNFAALLARKPFGIRYYGTFLATHLEDNYFRFFRRNLLKSLVYNLPKKFMIITNDGTKGDLVYKKLCLNKSLYKFHFWLNGVNKTVGGFSTDVNTLIQRLNITNPDNLIIYPARFDPWKRQELGLKILEKLNLQYGKRFELLFCGHKYDLDYFKRIQETASYYGLGNYVHFSDPLDTPDLHLLMSRSFAVFSMYEFSNLGNVLIEASLLGSLVITISDGSTSFLIENMETGLALPMNEEYISSMALQIINLSEKKEFILRIRENLKRKAEKVFLSWEERSMNEIELIENSIKNYDS